MMGDGISAKWREGLADILFASRKPPFKGSVEGYPRIRFKGKEYYFCGSNFALGGPIATKEQYENFECSYAHLFRDGKVRRFNEVIGTREDIEIIEEEVK